MSTFDFSHLQVRHGMTATYDVVEIDTPTGTLDRSGKPLRHPRLTLAPATRDTKPYWTRSLKRAGRRGLRVRIDDTAIEEGREEDLDLFPKYIVKGWDGVFDTSGNAVAFSEEACGKFLQALPDWIFGNLRIWAKDPTNFLAEDTPSAEEVAEQGNA